MAEETILGTITSVSVKGFKSLAEEQKVEIRPLTLLAGVNSSGKSSVFQPLLMLKQTLEATYDPGPLLLNGPHVKFTSAQQILSKFPGQRVKEEFEIRLILYGIEELRSTFRRSADDGFDLVAEMHRGSAGSYVLKPGLSDAEVEEALPFLKQLRTGGEPLWKIERLRCFLGLVFRRAGSPVLMDPFMFDEAIRSVIHLPGLRGNPERAYPTSAVTDFFEGTFENYVASVILSWRRNDDERLEALGENLSRLGLTSRVVPNPIDATRVEILVARLPRRIKKSDHDLVNIVDVGFGVSQVLPMVVALLQARPRQLVYIEQPELHLHPRAQQALASVLADAANRGVRVVAETHSTILLRAVQTLVAEDKLDPAKVILHWFQRDKQGATEVTSAELDEHGAYGDWPEDFGEVEATVDNAYLDAVEAKMFPPEKKRNARK